MGRELGDNDYMLSLYSRIHKSGLNDFLRGNDRT
jgi:hypothetical protein